MMRVSRRMAGSLFLVASTMPVGEAWAQAKAQSDVSAADGEAVELADIVVTATKRDQNLQSIPASITAIGSKELATRGVQSIGDIVSGTSNFQFNGAFGESLPVFAIRGITTLNFGPTETSPVATYYDEVYKGDLTLLGIGVYDLERIEVLKGPQGTLYGRSTTGGAVNLISRKPEFQNQGNVSLSYGNFDRITAEGGVEAALGEGIGARIGFNFDRGDGVIKNVFPGALDVQSTRQYAVRGSLRFRPNESIDVVIRASTSLQNNVPASSAIVPIPGPSGIGGPLGVPGYVDFYQGMGRHEVNTPDAFRARFRTYALSANANIRLSDDLSLTSITSFDKGNFYNPNENDGSPLEINFFEQRSQERQFAQDLRLTSDMSGPFNFILGGYFGRNAAHNGTNFIFFGDLDVNGDGVVDANDCIDGNFFPACTYVSGFDSKKKSIAAYTDFSYEVVERLTLRGGLRFSRETGKTYNYFLDVADADGNSLASLITGASAAFRNNKLSVKAGIDYKTEGDTLLYASYNIGYRASALNGGVSFSPGELQPSKPERLRSTEIGFKSTLFDRRMRFNGAAFWYDFKDQQVTSIDPTAGFITRVLNVPKSRVLGIELDSAARVTDRLTVNFSLGLIDSKVQRGQVNGIDVRGARLTFSPNFSLSAGVDYTLPLGSWGAAELHGDMAHSGNQYYQIINEPDAKEPGYSIFNARVRVHPESDRFGFALWMKNITNEYYRTYRLPLPQYGYTLTNVSNPRTYGVTLDAKF